MHRVEMDHGVFGHRTVDILDYRPGRKSEEMRDQGLMGPVAMAVVRNLIVQLENRIWPSCVINVT